MEAQLQSIDMAINSLTDVVVARRKGLNEALKMGFSTPDATKIAVVISELGRNIMLYAKKGVITLLIPQDGEYIKIIAEDQGPGI
ncbi:MAG: ATP-binding protein, partial [Anaerolineae bacterium]|nr:ATP-binding protein [Anaerolineae bacterium]